MRILHVLAPAATGGLEQVVHSLVLGMRQRSHDAHIAAVLTPDSGDPSSHAFLAGFRDSDAPVHVLRVASRSYIQEHAEIRSLCRRIAPTVVHTHGYRSDLIGAAAARRECVPTVTTSHGFTRGGLRNRFYEHLQRRAFSSFDAVIAVSAPMFEQLVRAGVSPKRLHFIRNAAPIPVPVLPRDQARERLGISKDGHQIGWVGRLSHEKGPDILLDALALIPDERIGATYIGAGPLQEMLRQTAHRKKLQERVRFAGCITPAASLLRAFDVLVLSSRTEGTPIVLFEAMEAQVPIVAVRVGGVPDVIDENSGGLLERPDPVLLARALINLLGNPARRRQLAQHAAARLHRYFSRGPWLAAHEQLYSKLTNTRPVHV